MTVHITRERLDEIARELRRAGHRWVEAARAMPEVADAVPGDDQWRDRVTLVADADVAPPTWKREHVAACVLYRDEVGRWWHTGWSDTSKAGARRPGEWRYNEDAGVRVRAADQEEHLSNIYAAQVRLHHAEEEAARLRDTRDELVTDSVTAEVSMYQIAQTTGLTQHAVNKIVRRTS